MTEHASADAMMAAAGLTGEFAEGTRPGLTAALASLAVESGLSDEGKGRAFAQFQDNLGRLAAIASDRAAHPEIADVAARRVVVEDAHDDLLAPHGRQGRDAEVDHLATVLHRHAGVSPRLR